MTLEPKFEHAVEIMSEICVSGAAKMAMLLGESTANKIIVNGIKKVGYDTTEDLVKRTRVRGHNAASAMYVKSLILDFVGIKYETIKSTPECSEWKILVCPEGEVVKRYEKTIVCNICDAIDIGIRDYFDKNIDFRWLCRISEGADYCHGRFEVKKPLDTVRPESYMSRFLVKLGKLTVKKENLFVDLLSYIFTMYGKHMIKMVGQDASLISARSTEEGGRYLGQRFISELGLKGGLDDASKLVKEIRETIGCKVEVEIKVFEEVEVITKNCPFAKKCEREESNFIEVACASYTEGFISPLGDYQVAKIEKGCYGTKTCRQVIKKREEKQIENKEAYEAILDELVDAKTITASAIITTTGRPVVSKMEKDVDEKLFAELSATMIGAGGTAINELKTGTSDRVILESSEARVVIIRAGGEMLLVAMSHLETKLGLVLLRMGRVTEKLVDMA